LNIIIAFIFIKFIFYPAAGILMGTGYPLVAVVSGSMEHMKIDHEGGIPNLCGNNYPETSLIVGFDDYWKECGEWYENKNITQSNFSNFYFKNGFNKGDIIFIYGENPKNLKIGDVIVFKRKFRSDPIIHRVVEINEGVEGKLFFVTKGDHNSGSALGIDVNINEEIIIGKGVFRVPYLGWIKIWAVDAVSWLRNIRNI